MQWDAVDVYVGIDCDLVSLSFTKLWMACVSTRLRIIINIKNKNLKKHWYFKQMRSVLLYILLYKNELIIF